MSSRLPPCPQIRDVYRTIRTPSCSGCSWFFPPPTPPFRIAAKRCYSTLAGHAKCPNLLPRRGSETKVARRSRNVTPFLEAGCFFCPAFQPHLRETARWLAKLLLKPQPSVCGNSGVLQKRSTANHKRGQGRSSSPVRVRVRAKESFVSGTGNQVSGIGNHSFFAELNIDARQKDNGVSSNMGEPTNLAQQQG